MDNRDKRATQLKVKLINEIGLHFPEWNIDSLKLVGYGVENAVFCIESNDHGLLAIRVPWERTVSNDNDGTLDSRDQLRKEAELAGHCFTYGLPVPQVYHLHLSENIDFLVSQYIKGDGEQISDYEIGVLTSKLHHIRITTFQTVDPRKISGILSERITRRNEALRRITSTEIVLPNEQEIKAILQEDDHKTSLLHMDIRPANLIGEKGRIRAIVDWNNALVGNPILDVMRILETEEVNARDFLDGYNQTELIKQTSEIIRNFYRLDTAIMLSILFLSYLRDSEKGHYYFNRVLSLSKSIRNDNLSTV